MGDEKTPTGCFSWCTFGAAALGAHLLLLWSLPVAPLETAFTAATTVIEWESWQAPAASTLLSNAANGAEPAAALPVDRGETARKAPESRTGDAKAVPPPPTHTARTNRAAARGRGAELQHDAAPARTNSGEALRAQATELQHDAASARTNSGEALRAQAAEPQQQVDSAPATAASASLAQAAAPALARSESADATTSPTSRESAKGAPDTQLAAVGNTSAGGSHPIAGHGRAPGALLRGPRLLAAHDPCAGFFPGMAEAKRGQVQLSVHVDAQGHPHPTQTLLELPRGQGFENAAKACAAHLHFAPALDAQGRPVNASARIALRFERS